MIRAHGDVQLIFGFHQDEFNLAAGVRTADLD